MIKKNVILPIAVVLLVAACGGGAGKDKTGDDKADSTLAARDTLALIVGVMPTLDCLPLYVARDEGLFDSLQADVQLACYDDGLDCCRDFVAGLTDCCVTDLVRAGWMLSDGCDVAFITATDAYWILTANRLSRISRLNQLADKTLAMTRFSVCDMLADMASDSARLAADAVFRVQINNPKLRLKMIITNEIDAAVLTEPQASAARTAGHTALIDSRNATFRPGVIVTTESYLADRRHRELTERLKEAYNRAVERINSRGVKAYSDIIVRYMGADGKTVAALPEITFDTVKAPRPEDVEKAEQWVKSANNR